MGFIRLILLAAIVSSACLIVFNVRHLAVEDPLKQTEEPSQSRLYEKTSKHQQTSQSHTARPPLETLVNGTHIIGNVKSFLDFAIIGFPKCGTTSFSLWLRKHPEIEISGAEWYDLSKGKPESLVVNLYNQLREGNYKRGYKAPLDVTNDDALDSFQKYWPETRLIVGLRHPILWFQSFYNYRLLRGRRMPKPNDLLTECRKGFCVKTANFHVYLARLGKTAMTSAEEVQMRLDFPDVLGNLSSPVANKVLIYDMEQLGDRNETRSALFHYEIQQYLGLEEEMPSIVHTNKGRRRRKEPKKQSYIDICNVEYEMLRGQLMEISKSASVWIRKHFIESEDVFTPSRQHFEQILESWMYDPCDKAENI